MGGVKIYEQIVLQFIQEAYGSVNKEIPLLHNKQEAVKTNGNRAFGTLAKMSFK